MAKAPKTPKVSTTPKRTRTPPKYKWSGSSRAKFATDAGNMRITATLKKLLSKSKAIEDNIIRFTKVGVTVGIHDSEGKKVVQKRYVKKMSNEASQLSKIFKLVRSISGSQFMNFAKRDAPKKIGYKFTVFKLALQNEFGKTITFKKKAKVHTKDGKYIVLKKGKTIVIPARPFIRPIYTDPMRENAIKLAVTHCMYPLMNPRPNIKNMWSQIGESAKQQIQSELLRISKYPPNSLLAIAVKGFDLPLFETGKHLLRSVKFKVVRFENDGSIKTRKRSTTTKKQEWLKEQQKITDRVMEKHKQNGKLD
jgi:hypothetical protein